MLKFENQCVSTPCEKIFALGIVIAFILLAFFMSSCFFGVYDPGWLYMLHQPSLDRIEQKEDYGYKYIYRSDSLNIKLTADDFAFDTYVVLKITTTLDSIIIYPNFSYIESPHFVNKAHAPSWINVEYFSTDSLVFKKRYAIDETKGKFGLVSLEAWREDRINIEDFTEHKKAKKIISKDEILRPYCLHNGDSLSVYFTYLSFAVYDERNNQRNPFSSPNFTSEKSDFILRYDIYNNKKPLTFYFKPATCKTEE